MNKYKYLAISLATAVMLVLGSVVWLQAGPAAPAAPAAEPQTARTIDAVAATPTVIPVGAPTQVTVTAQISDPSVIPTGVNLLRLNPNGTSTILGVMRDDGTNGDVAANDKVFTLKATFNEAQTGEIRVQVSAAFRGQLRRVLSGVVSVRIWPLTTTSFLILENSSISVAYPAGWNVSETADGSVVSISSPSADFDSEHSEDIYIAFRENPNDLNVQLFFHGTVGPDFYTGATVTEVQLAGHRALRFVGAVNEPAGEVIVIPVEHGFWIVGVFIVSEISNAILSTLTLR